MGNLGTRAGDKAPLRVRKQEGPSQAGKPGAIQKEVYDSDSDTEDISANCIDRLCDFVTDVERFEDDGALKEIYTRCNLY